MHARKPLPSLNVYADDVGALVRMGGEDLHVAEGDVTGVAHEETLGRQVTPHGGFWVGLFFLISDGIGNFLQFIGLHASFVMESFQSPETSSS